MRLPPAITAPALALCLAGGPLSAQEVTLALTGDAIITRRISVYDEPDFLEMIGLVREADAAFTNLEMRADFNRARYRDDTTGFPANREVWESVIAHPTFEGGALKELALHPITPGFGEPPWVRGRPMLARGDLAEKILNDLRDRSSPYRDRHRDQERRGVRARR